MTDDEARMVQERVEDYLGSKGGRWLDVGNPSHLALLVDFAGSGSADIVEDDLRMVAAMCWLGPQAAGIPPPVMRHDLLDMLRRCVPDEPARLERVMEFVIAYGCGKWRQVQAGSGGWEHRWQGAMRGLARALEPAVSQANRWLAEHIVGFPQDRTLPPSESFVKDTAAWSDAWVLAMRLVHPEHLLVLAEEENLTLECTPGGTELGASAGDYQMTAPPGAKAVWTVREKEGALLLSGNQSLPLTTDTTVFLVARDEDAILKTVVTSSSQQVRLKVGEAACLNGPVTLALWECTCGTTHCMERHRLDTWDPVRTVQKTVMGEQKTDAPLTLWDYVAAAVKGPQASIKTGAFVQGIYFPLLAQESFAS